MAKERALYKIWDITNKKYVSGNRSKTTWNSLVWVENKIADLCATRSYSQFSPRRNPSEFEIRKFELTCVDSFSGTEIYLNHRKKSEEREKKLIEQKKLRVQIENMIPEISFHAIRSLVRSKMFASDKLSELEDLIEEYDNLSKQL